MNKWWLLGCLIPAAVSAQANSSLAITHITVIDCTGAPPKENSTVVVVNGRITSIRPSDSIVIASGTRVIDGTGKFLIPGLWDMHGHLTDAGETAFPLLIMNGVTGIRDMGGDLAKVDRWKGEIENGSRVGPHIVRAGPFVDGPKPRARHRLTVRTADEARQAVHQLKAQGVDFIKVHNGLPPEAFFALLAEAKKERVPVAVHLPKNVSSAEASDSGAASLEHIETTVESTLWKKGATAKTIWEALDEDTGPLGQALYERFAKNGTYYDPTLTAYERGFVLWSNQPEAMVPRLKVHRQQMQMVAMMHKAGVPILAGTDFTDWGQVPGIDLHNELALFVEAGFSPLEALQTATLNPAKFLGRTEMYGTIQPGRAADMVILTMNPIEDISHTRKIDAVVLGGRYYPIAALMASALKETARQ